MSKVSFSFWLTSVLLFLLLGTPRVGASGGERVVPKFREAAQSSGLIFQHRSGSPEKQFILESMSGGVALFDADNDGWMDIYLVNGGELADLKAGRRRLNNALFRNRGDGSFEDITASAGVPGGLWDMGATAADVDDDGHVDLLVTGFSGLILYRNRGDGTFQDITAQAGLTDQLWSTGAAFSDYDGDGRLDLAVAHYVVFDPDNPPPRTPLCNYRGIDIQCGPRGLPGTQDDLFRNLGGGRFEKVTQKVGLATGNLYYGLGVVWADYDNDGDQDLFIANDSCPNFLFRNENGMFREVAMEAGVGLNEDGQEQAGMGVDFADVDGDGWLDALQTNFSDDKNTLYANQQDYFIDASYKWRLGEISWQYLGWGTFFFDADLDGWLDLFVANGHVYPQVDDYQIGTSYRQRDFLFQNRDGEYFDEVGEAAGLAQVLSSRGAASGDLNNDGRLDIVVNHIDGPPALYWNETPVGSRNWIGLDLRTANGAPAIGARVQVTLKDGGRVAEVRSGSSYLSTNDHRIVLGFGQEKPDEIMVRWPDGTTEKITDWTLNSYHKRSSKPLKKKEKTSDSDPQREASGRPAQLDSKGSLN